jgi:hypothetical protein
VFYPTVTGKEAHAVPVLHKMIDSLAADEFRTAPGNKRFHGYLMDQGEQCTTGFMVQDP